MAAHDLKPKPEVGIQWGAGGDASVEELESAGSRDPKWLIDRANTFLQAGAHVGLLQLDLKIWTKVLILTVLLACHR